MTPHEESSEAISPFAEVGHYHHIAGDYLFRYAQESSWREDHRRLSNGDQFSIIASLAMHKTTSVAS